MRFEILGPLRVSTAEGAEVVLRSRHERVLLSMLLVRPGQAATTESLVEALWPDRRPASYASNLQTYVSRLRERLSGVAIEHVGGGYRLRLGADGVAVSTSGRRAATRRLVPGRLPGRRETVGHEDQDPRGSNCQEHSDQVDLLEFRREVAVGRAALAAGDVTTAVIALRGARNRWRGRPFADVDVPALEPYLAQWEVEQLSATEDWVDAELAASEHLPEVLAELHRLVAQHPLRERLHGQLMVALTRCGRRADALAVYLSAREVLVTELGIEPGPQLSGLHRAILRGEEPPHRYPGQALPAASTPRWLPVCQLPPALSGFVGRAELVATVAGLLRPAAEVSVVALSGQPGVGKSALALVVAHQVRETFPDGQLYVHLADASARPRDSAAALADVLRSLGTPESAIPQGLSALSSAYRARVADRRVLIVVDDANDPAQVRPLIPGTPGSAMLIASRRRLSGLIDARHVSVGPLSDSGAAALLAHVVGADRVGAEHEQAVRITAACGNLPLALRIAGTRLATRPWGLRTLADRLENEQHRLSELAVGDQQVRAALALSVRALSPPARRAFGLLGVPGATSFAPWAIAALLGAGIAAPSGDRRTAYDDRHAGIEDRHAGLEDRHAALEDRHAAPETTGSEVDAIIEELVEASLVEPVEPAGGEPRYRLHDLLRVYADELTAGASDAREQALHRLLDAIVVAARRAAAGLPRTLTWSRPAGTGRGLAAGGEKPYGSGPGPEVDPIAWFTAELPLLRNAVLMAFAVGADARVIDIVRWMAPFLWVRGRWSELRTVLPLAHQAAERLGDQRALAQLRFLAGVLSMVCGDLAAAGASFTDARTVFEGLDDRHGLACVLSDQAVLHDYHSRFAESAANAGRAIELFRDESDPVAAVLASPALSAALRGLGRLDSALHADQTAVVEARREGAAEVVLARALNSLAVTRLLRAEPLLAYAAAAESVELLRRVGDRYVLLAALRHLASAAAGLGQRAQAVRLLRESLELATELGDRVWANGLERDLAVSLIGEGRAAEAIPVLRRCAQLYRDMDLRSAAAVTLDMLARGYDALNDRAAAQRARRDAEALGKPRDARSQLLSEIILRLAEDVGGSR